MRWARNHALLVGDLQGAVQLVGRDALLAGGHKVHRLQPNVQGELALLEDGPDPHGELALALAALLQAHPDALLHVGLDGRDAAHAAAGRAHRALRPQNALDLGKGGGFIVEVRGGEDGHSGFPSPLFMLSRHRVCKVYNRLACRVRDERIVGD